MDSSKKCVGNNPFCTDCKPDHEAVRADAIEQGKKEVFERARKDPELYRKLLLDYRANCASKGRGIKRRRYDWSRYEQLVDKVRSARRGGEATLIDWFDFKEYFEKKKIPLPEIEARWQK
eukprot:174720-Pyramimonas_sp.AAC.1